jgi:hypothetical protein
MSSRLPARLTIALLLLWVAVALLPDRRPEALDADAPASSFSAARAVDHLRVIARQPHPVGSAEHDRVRDEIAARARAHGAEVELQEAVVFRPSRARRQTGVVGRVANVLARLPGRGNGTAILVDAHYDSVFTGPGASDDGVGVAVMLETLRALRAGPPLDNDVVFNLSDAEEVGLLGAAAFVERHPWAADVGLVLNLEARGTGGPAIMFQTSGPGRDLVRELGRAAPFPTASSLTYDVYRRLPNDTNFSVYRGAGWPGYDFAFIQGVTAYHTALDSLDHVDPRTVQHLGDAVLALCRHFGGLPLDRLTAAEKGGAVYFDLLGRTLLAYPASWALPLAALVVGLALAVALLAAGRRTLPLREVVGGWLLAGGAVAGSAAVAAGLRLAVMTLHPSTREMESGELYNGALYAGAYSLLAVALTSALLAVTARWRQPLAAPFGALLWWVALAPLSALLLPGGSHLASWPTLGALLALVIQVRSWPEVPGEHPPLVRTAAVAGLALPAVLLLAPTVALLWVGLTTALAWVIAPVAALATLLLAPQLELVARTHRRLVPAAAAAAALALLLAGSVTGGFDRERPRPNSVRYELDADGGAARWVSFDHRLDPWTAQYIPAGTPAVADDGPRFTAPAPSLALQPPAVDVLERLEVGGRERLRLRVRSPRGAPVLKVRAGGAEVTALEVAGAAVPEGARARLSLTAHALGPDGFDMVVELPSGRPLGLELEDRSYGLPEVAGISPRAEDMIAKPSGLSDLTVVRTTVEIPAG